MSALRLDAASRPVVPPLVWWLLLLPLLGLVVLGKALVALAVLALAVVMRARPFHFLTSYLVVVVVGSFINYGGGSGSTAAQMWVLTGFLVFMLYCYVLSRRWDSLVVPVTPATKPLLLFFLLTLVNFARGIAVGNSAKYAGLELLACLALTSGLLVASRRLSERELWVAMIVMWAMSVGHFALGAYVFSIIHMRTIGVYFSPVPGVVAMMMFNFALREPRRSRMLLWLVAMGPLLAQQFLSFTRGFWIALMAGVLFSLITYVGRRDGAMLRARRAAVSLLMLGGMAALGILVIAVALGIGHVWMLAGNRLASSTGTTYTWASTSNVVRLLEYVHVIEDIQRSPIFGHGLGFSFVFREPIQFTLHEQWYCHENYLLVWLKQGLIGLVLWVWLLVGFVRTGLRGGRLENRVEQSWCMGAAALVVYCMVYGLVHFPLAETNTTFTFALATGVAMRLTATDTVALRWKGRRTVLEPV
jgi:O-antigen ligase